MLIDKSDINTHIQIVYAEDVSIMIKEIAFTFYNTYNFFVLSRRLNAHKNLLNKFHKNVC